MSQTATRGALRVQTDSESGRELRDRQMGTRSQTRRALNLTGLCNCGAEFDAVTVLEILISGPGPKWSGWQCEPGPAVKAPAGPPSGH